MGSVKMFSSVFVRRRITAAHMPAAKAEAQMYPPIARFQTILTTLSARRNLLDLVKMLAFNKSSSFIVAIICLSKFYHRSCLDYSVTKHLIRLILYCAVA